MVENSGSAPGASHLQAVTDALDAAGVDYDVHEHSATYSAAEEASVEQVPSQRVAKSVVVRDGDEWLLAVVPGSCRLDLHKLRELLGASKQLRLASEKEMAEHFPQFDVGAVPPVASGAPAEVVDARLLDEEKVVFAAGDHTHSVLMAVQDLVRIAGAKVADICQD